MIKFTTIISTLIKKASQFTDKNNYIFYRIIEQSGGGDKLLLQCINTSVLFYATLDEIINDIDILYGLSPTQACYVGVEYAHLIKQSKPLATPEASKVSISKYSACRYGNLIIHSQDRYNNIHFFDKQTSERFSMDPRDLALSDLVEQFDAIQAFYIGVLTGSKINKPRKLSLNSNHQQPYLRLIK